MYSAIAEEPTNPIARTRGSVSRASTASLSPLTTLRIPGGNLQYGLGLFNGVIIPGPKDQRPREDRRVGAGQHFPGHLFDNLVFIGLKQSIIQPLSWVRQRNPQLSP